LLWGWSRARCAVRCEQLNPYDGLEQLIALLRPQQFARYARRFMWLVPLLLSTLAAGCGAARNPILGRGGTAVLAPTVIAVLPRDNTTGGILSLRLNLYSPRIKFCRAYPIWEQRLRLSGCFYKPFVIRLTMGLHSEPMNELDHPVITRQHVSV
jgi:hypothetical protein